MLFVIAIGKNTFDLDFNTKTDTTISSHTWLEAPIGVKKFAKNTNPLGPSGGKYKAF